MLKDLKEPSGMVQDSILFFSSGRSRHLLLEEKVAQRHLYDVPDFAYTNYTGILKIIEKEQRRDSVQMINNIVSSSREIVDKYNFDIVSWMDRRPFFDSPNRISKKKGIYIRCRPINGIWYLAKYPTLKSKLADLELNLNKEKPEFIEEANETIRVSYKDSMTIAYPVKLK